MDWLMSHGLSLLYAAIGVAGIGGLLNLILKKFITKNLLEKLESGVEKIGFGLGRSVTLGLAKWKWTKPVWNKIIEPYVITIIRIILLQLLVGLTRGLQSDNPSVKDD